MVWTMQVVSKEDAEVQEKNPLSHNVIELKKFLCKVIAILAKLKYWLIYLKLKLNFAKATKLAAWSLEHPEKS